MTSSRHGDKATEERRQAALAAFLGSGLPTPPSTALMVQALASARRQVAAHKNHGHDLDQWLASEIRQRGIRENAAVLAVLETPAHRAETAQNYREQHPDRSASLNDLLAVLDHT